MVSVILPYREWKHNPYQGLHVRAKMASKGRQGSAEKTSAIPHTRIEDETQMEEIYQVKDRLGEGSFGVVKEVVHLATNQRWACKAINKEKAGSSKIKLLEREVAILKRVHHEHIICLKEVFETSAKMYLVMELCEGGELAHQLKNLRKMNEATVKTIMSRLASAISYLHKNDMVHRDLKLENILLSENPDDSSDKLYIKVTDFGLSVVKGGVGHENMMMDFCGTPMYMAPEIIDNKTYGALCDVWAMGVIMFNLISGCSPYKTTNDEELYEMIKNADIKKIIAADPHWKNISQEAKELMAGMMNTDPAHRYTASEVLNDSWITGETRTKNQPKNVLEMMKEWGPMLGKDEDETSPENGTEDVSGSGSPEICCENGAESASSSRNGSASSKKPKSGGPHRSSASTTPSSSSKGKKLTRNTTDPNLQKTANSHKTASDKTLSSSRGVMSKSKSPTDRDVGRTGFGNTTGRATPGHHTAKPAATRTSTSLGATNNSRLDNVKTKKKINR